MGDRIKTKVKTVSLRKDIADKLDEYAKKENRSISNFVETVLIKYFDKIDSPQ